MKFEKTIKLDIQNFSSLEVAIEELRDKEMINYSRNVELPPMMGDVLFPDRKTQSLTAGFVESNAVLPVIASVHGFDTKAELGTRDGFKAFEFDKLLVKRELVLSEKMMMNLHQPRNESEYNEILETIFDDAYNLMLAVKSRFEAMKLEVLSEGEINIDENNVKIKLDYLVPSDHKAKLTGTGAWSDLTNSDPISDMQKWSDKIVEDTGIKPTRALTSTKVLRLLQKNVKIQKAINGNMFEGRAISEAMLNEFLEIMDLPRIATYDGQYRQQSAENNTDGTPKYTKKRYLNEKKFIMFGDEILGEGLYGPTPTELRKIRSRSIDQSFGNIYVITREEDDPVITKTKAEGLMIPTFPAYKEVYQAQVLE